MDKYDLVIILGLFGFLAVAAILLIPVYRFLVKQEEASKKWTDENMSEHLPQNEAFGDGQPQKEN